MSYPDFRIGRLGLTAAAAFVAIATIGTAAAQSMVVRSTGPSATKYPTGTKLKANDRLTLVAGDKVVLIQGGKTRTLTGAGTFSASGTVQVSQSSAERMTQMLAKRPPRQSRGGFSRGDVPAAAAIRAPNLWLLDYREGGTFCVADPAMLLLWRPEATLGAVVTVEGGGKRGSVEMGDSQIRKWPVDVPLQFGVDYLFSGGGLAAPVKVRFTPIEAMPETADTSADMLMAKGCTPQFDRLVDTMAEAETATG